MKKILMILAMMITISSSAQFPTGSIFKPEDSTIFKKFNETQIMFIKDRDILLTITQDDSLILYDTPEKVIRGLIEHIREQKY